MFFIFALHDDDNIKGYLLILNIMENNDDMHFRLTIYIYYGDGVLNEAQKNAIVEQPKSTE